jgi:hypothetical protein
LLSKVMKVIWVGAALSHFLSELGNL